MKVNKMAREMLLQLLLILIMIFATASTISANQAPTLEVSTAVNVAPQLPPLASLSQQQQPEPVSPTGHEKQNVVGPNQQLQQEPQMQRPAPVNELVMGPKLPKVNIFVDKREIKKLLGNDAIIYYVRNGEINKYPLGFTIPVGFNHSDMVFTWQNLGQTNVNYSISLVIGNIQAVLAPKINITRSGLIPRHEQVFKITLPCSGKVNEEVDVQVLINITGQVGEEAAAESGQQELETNSTNGELVSHTLAIKRKKICAQQPSNWAHHPPPSRPQLPPPSPQPFIVMPPNQPPRPKPAPSPSTAPRLAPAPVVQPPAFKAMDDSSSTQSPPPQQPQSSPNEQPPESPAVAPLELHPPPQAPPLPTYPNWRLASPNDINIGGAKLPVSGGQQVPSGQQTTGSGGTSPLLAAVLLLSLAVSLILVLVVIMGSSAHTSTGQHTFSNKSPLDKLGSLLAGSLLGPANKRGTPASSNRDSSSGATSAHGKLPIIGSLRLPKHSQVDSSGSLTLASGQHKQQPYYYKSSQCFYNQYQHQQPLTADLLGTGYSSCSSGGGGGQPHYPPPIYHIANQNPNQTTRLIWNQGADGYTLDAAAYMPLSSGANRSDSGSVYQTIY